MIDIWQECASFQTTSKKLADQVRTIINRGGFLILKYFKYTRKHINQIIQYHTYEVSSNKNDLTEMKCLFLKMKTPLYQTADNQVTLRKHYHKNKR